MQELSVGLGEIVGEAGWDACYDGPVNFDLALQFIWEGIAAQRYQ